MVRRQTVELLHGKVEGLTVDQGILGRILNFGTVMVNGTGSGRTPIRGISEPLEFRSPHWPRSKARPDRAYRRGLMPRLSLRGPIFIEGCHHQHRRLFPGLVAGDGNRARR
ncbi:PH domain-containing protein [Luteimonas terricola]|uniref:PH domain-containing protein n=1 Tax=Luteimonas terricola TaxID=645597 RepID=UPI003CCE44DA